MSRSGVRALDARPTLRHDGPARRSPIHANRPAPAKPAAEDDPRHALVRARDGRADGTFVYAVRTTGVFCRPSCPSRPAKPENIAFYDDAQAARRAGYRACLRCRPEDLSRDEHEARLVAQVCRALEASDELPTLASLAEIVGIGTAQLQRVFRRVTGLTPHAYAQEMRGQRVRSELAAGSAVTAAFHRAGYGSSGRFYEQADAVLGMTPTSRRQQGAGLDIEVAVGTSSLGHVLVAWTTRGICAVALGDDGQALRTALAKDFARARIREADSDGAAILADVLRLVEQPGSSPQLPLDLQGTLLQMQVWQALRKVPPGSTITYTELAKRVGRPDAVRAVASACARNRVALLVPCHRVVRGDGSLAGYHWGVERKRALLAREEEPLSSP